MSRDHHAAKGVEGRRNTGVASPNVHSGGAPLADELTDHSNVLLLSESRCTAKKNACLDLMSIDDPASESMVGVMYPSPELFVDRIHSELGTIPPKTTVVSVTEDDESVADDVPIDSEPEIANVDPDEVTQITEHVKEFRQRVEREQTGPIVLCFNSLTPLLEDVGRERTFQFLDSLTDELDGVNGVAHFHMDPNAHDSQTLLALTTLFDAVVESPDGEEWTRVY